MAPILYKMDVSPPCRGIFLIAKALEVELDYQDINLAAGEHMEEEFLEKNPQHTLPFLEDEDFTLADSNAIAIYLASKYCNEDTADFYPEDEPLRNLIHHRLFYNCGTLQSLIGRIVRPFFFEGVTTIDEKIIDKTINAYNILEKFLGDREWMVGDTTTIADLSIIASISSLNVLVPIDEEACPKLIEWIARMEGLPYYEANSAGLEIFKEMHEKALAGAEENE